MFTEHMSRQRPECEWVLITDLASVRALSDCGGSEAGPQSQRDKSRHCRFMRDSWRNTMVKHPTCLCSAAIAAVLLVALTVEDARGDFLILKSGKSFGGTLKSYKDGSFATSETEFRYGKGRVARASREKTAQDVIEKWSGELGDGRSPSIRDGYLCLAKFCMYQKLYREAKTFFERTGRSREWKVATSKYYFILSNTKVKRIKEVRDRLDAIMTFYQKEFGDTRPPSRDFVVRFFKTEASFDEFARKAGLTGAGAFYSPEHRELVLWDMSLTDKNATFEAVYHEANHQYLGAYYMDHEAEYMWFCEGMANYYESAKFRGGRIVGHRKKQLIYLADMKEAMRGNGLEPWATFLPMKRDAFYCGGKREGTNYAQAWGLVYFLKQTKDAKCRGFLKRYIEVLREKKDDAAALAEAYKVASLEHIEKKFKAFKRKF
jgi:Protein of unknown function (DUF1570)